jgi:arabinan endo-1,5-alpha-L-arabinosidase
MRFTFYCLALFCGWMCAAHGQVREDGKPVFSGDPTLFHDGGHFYVFGSGERGAYWTSEDLYTWRQAGELFKTMPEWALAVVPEQGRKHYVWAPDVCKVNGEYRVYWSTSTNGSRRSVIGLMVNRTLDPKSPDYRWEDRGMIIRTQESSDWNAIDPHCVVDQQGNAWLQMGSYWTGIKMHLLDKKTGLLSKEDVGLYSLAQRKDVDPPALEGAFTIWRDGYYYLFVSFDRCHLGIKSDYNIRVGRSKKITGPYMDRAGRSLLNSGGTLVFKGQGDIHGPGHNSVMQHAGRTWTAYHYFAQVGFKTKRVLQIRELTWDAEGWPVAGGVVGKPRKKP